MRRTCARTPIPYFDGRAVGCIVCADGAQSLGSTLAALRSIIHALRGWPTPFAAAINADPVRSAAARAIPPEVVHGLELVAGQVVEFARMRRHYIAALGPRPRRRSLPASAGREPAVNPT